MFGTQYDYPYSQSNDVNSSSYLFLLENELHLLFSIPISEEVIHVHDDKFLKELNKMNTFIIKEQEGDINYERLQNSYSIGRKVFLKQNQVCCQGNR
jgi:hypothetical protein